MSISIASYSNRSNYYPSGYGGQDKSVNTHSFQCTLSNVYFMNGFCCHPFIISQKFSSQNFLSIEEFNKFRESQICRMWWTFQPFVLQILWLFQDQRTLVGWYIILMKNDFFIWISGGISRFFLSSWSKRCVFFPGYWLIPSMGIS